MSLDLCYLPGGLWSNGSAGQRSLLAQKFAVVLSSGWVSSSMRPGPSLAVMSQNRHSCLLGLGSTVSDEWTVMPMARVFRISAHVALFVAALFVFFFGLGVGLAHSPLYGSLLWVAAGVICVGNLWWMVNRKLRN